MKLMRRTEPTELDRPFDFGFDRIREQIESAIERAFRGFEPMIPRFRELEPWPQLDMIEDETGLVIEADVPGLGPKDIEVEVIGNQLRIRGLREEKHEEEKAGLHRYERHFGRFARTVTIPEYLDPEKVEARYDKGMLTIRLPRLPGKGPRRIPIKTT